MARAAETYRSKRRNAVRAEGLMWGPRFYYTGEGGRVSERRLRRRGRNRKHGLLKDIDPTPKMIASAKKRARLYMHSVARRRISAADPGTT